MRMIAIGLMVVLSRLVGPGQQPTSANNGNAAARIDTPLPTSVTSGPIILQSQGAEVFYRALEMRSIRAIPSDYAVR